MATSGSSNDTRNFQCVTVASAGVIKLPLIDILASYIQPKDLFQKIKPCSTLQLRADQLKICFIPPPGVPDYNKFDVTLLYTLIRNLCSKSLPCPAQGWGKEPKANDTQISDDIERLRLFRNNFSAHAESAVISDAVFKGVWKNLKFVFRRIQSKTGSSVDYEEELLNIEQQRFTDDNFITCRVLLEALTKLEKQTDGREEPDIFIQAENEITCGDKAQIEAEVKNVECSCWSVTWQKRRGDVFECIDTSLEKYSGSTKRNLVINDVSKEDEGEYQAVVSLKSKGPEYKSRNIIPLYVNGYKEVAFHVQRDVSSYTRSYIHHVIKTVAVIIECKEEDTLFNGVRHSERFMLSLSVKEVYSGKLLALREKDRTKLRRLNIAYLIIDGESIHIERSKEEITTQREIVSTSGNSLSVFMSTVLSIAENPPTLYTSNGHHSIQKRTTGLLGYPMVTPLIYSGSSLNSGSSGAFQPKKEASGLLHLSQMIPGLREPDKVPSSVASLSHHKESGKWCSMHVQIAWKIHRHQQESPDVSKGGEGKSLDLLQSGLDRRKEERERERRSSDREWRGSENLDQSQDRPFTSWDLRHPHTVSHSRSRSPLVGDRVGSAKFDTSYK
nr:uncharacterized protein LOC117690918 isoform X2 [Crassostrea gigas]